MYAQTKRFKKSTAKPEKGIAVLVAVFALLLLTAASIALIYSTITETGVNSNYRQEEIAYFGARAGVEEARDRMATSGLAGEIPIASLPTVPPDQTGQAGSSVIYLINQGTDPSTVQPWSGNTANYMDDELCHDYAGFSQASVAPSVPCLSFPSNVTHSTVQTNTTWNPWAGTSADLPYKWVRIAVKANSSVQYGDPASGGTQTYYSVDSTQAATQPVCYDNNNERVPPAGTTTCAAWTTASPPVSQYPVYTITALAVAPSGARKVVQQEVALPVVQPFPYGLWATSTSCSAINFNGHNASTDSYTTANGGTYQTTQSNTGGDIGTLGGVSLGNGNVGGTVGVLDPSSQGGSGTCQTPFSIGPNGQDCVVNNGVTSCGTQAQGQGQPTYLGQSYTFPTPQAPNPATPNTTQSLTTCPGQHGANYCLSPATGLGNISLSGNASLTLSPGIYDINSLTTVGNASINVSPAGQVVINIGGTGLGSGTVMSIGGNGIDNTGTIPNNFDITYAGTGSISLGGNGQSVAEIDAPNAGLTMGGGGNSGAWYGSIVASTVTLTGNEAFHYDTAASQSPQNNQNFVTLAFRELTY